MIGVDEKNINGAAGKCAAYLIKTARLVRISTDQMKGLSGPDNPAEYSTLPGRVSSPKSSAR
jgi:hypothetical protein